MSIFDTFADSPLFNPVTITFKYIASDNDIVLDDRKDIDFENSTLTELSVDALEIDSPAYDVTTMRRFSGNIREDDRVFQLPSGYDYKEFEENSIEFRAEINSTTYIVKAFDIDEMFDNQTVFCHLRKWKS